jgi:hypothetical protein
VLIDDFEKVLDDLTPATNAVIETILDDRVDPFLSQFQNAKKIVSESLRSPQFALAASLKDPQIDDPERHLVFEAIYDQGLTPRTSFIINARYDRPEGHVTDDDQFSISSQLRYQLASARAKKNGSFVDFSAEAKLLHERIYKAQVKWTFPITGGIQVPVSITAANRTEAVDESNVVGHIGVSFDFAKVAEAFKK